MGEREDRLEAARLEMAIQDAEWQRANAALRALGVEHVSVRVELLEQLDAACMVHTVVCNGVRG